MLIDRSGLPLVPVCSATCGFCGVTFPRSRRDRVQRYCSVPCACRDRMRKRKMAASERFWNFVRISPGCWGWDGSRTTYGYGQLGGGGAGAPAVSAHRLSWAIHFGEIPAGLCVLHRCDNPPCTNPLHLFLGTKADNTADMMAKGRHRYGRRARVA